MKGRILITRPVKDSEPLEKYLNSLGFKTVISPLLEIHYLSPNIPNLSDYSALVFTSSNAVRSFIKLTDDRNIPVYNVGLKTHEILKEAGFKTIHTARNTAIELIEIINKTRFEKPLLFCRGKDILHDIKGHTPKLKIDEIVLYESKKHNKFTPEAENFLKSDQISEILLFSKRTIDSFFKALKTSAHQKQIIECMTRTRLLCLSSAMVEYASKLSTDKDLPIIWREIVSAHIPTQDSMIDLLK